MRYSLALKLWILHHINHSDNLFLEEEELTMIYDQSGLFSGNSTQFLVCPMKHAVVLMSVEGHHEVVPLDEELPVCIALSRCPIARF